jgi:prevent-host-death family protein
MSTRMTASDAKNHFGELLDQVLAQGRVDIVRHGRVVAVVLSARELEALEASRRPRPSVAKRESTHMFSPELARAARLVRQPAGFDDK